MECHEVREISSAGLDHEAEPEELRQIEQHIAGCPSCESWLDSLFLVNRATRLSEIKVPDLTGAIMAEWDRTRSADKVAPMWLRQAVAAMGVMSVAFSLPLLLGAQTPALTGSGNYPSRELAGLGMTLAAAFLVSAWNGKAKARLAVVATGIVVTVVASVADLIAGNVSLAYEVVHLPTFLGFVLMWMMARNEPSNRPKPTQTRFRLGSLREVA
ncbi:MAG: zf-HC2 domain-containing protein [Actinomycetota bacterium]